ALLPLDGLDSPEERFRLKHHPRTAAIRNIVDHPMAVCSELAQISGRNLARSAFDRTADDARPQRVLDHRRKNRDDVDAHHRCCRHFHDDQRRTRGIRLNNWSSAVSALIAVIKRSMSPQTFKSSRPSGGSITMRFPATSID